MMLSAADMLAALVDEPVERTFEGLGTVRVRGLTMLEFERIRLAHGNSDAEALAHVVAAGLVEPQLTPEQLIEMTLRRVTRLRPVYECIMALTADLAAEEAEQASFGGGG